MTAYYNEIDPYAAQWLRNLIAAGHIAPGVVDERSITDVDADELTEFVQCHFFAGVGVWSHALRSAGWDDNRPVWTGSCPCQPFSAAGKQTGTKDERHLWPTWFKLIEKRRPPVVFGEQVEAAIRHGWLDLVQADMEGIGYAFAAAGIPAAGVGAPHIRQRLYFVADAEIFGRANGPSIIGSERSLAGAAGIGERTCDNGKFIRLGNNNNTGLEGLGRGHQAESGRHGAVRPVAEAGEFGGLADNSNIGLDGWRTSQTSDGGDSSRIEPERLCNAGATGPTNGHWRNADWLFCRDGKWRPVEPSTFPLAHGATARVGRLRAYGNAIVAGVAKEMIAAYMSVRP